MQFVDLGQFEQVLPGYLLDQLAVEYDVDRCNQVRLPGQAVFACVLNALLNHELLTLRMLEETYQKKTGMTADHSSFGKRLAKIPPVYFRTIFEYLFNKIQGQITPGEAKALHLRFVDSTVVTLSAKLINFGLLHNNVGRKRTGSYRALKSVISLTDEGLPRFLRLAKAVEEHSEAKTLANAMLGHLNRNDLWVFDAGCHDRHLMLSLHQAGAYFLTPHSTQNLNARQTVWQAEPDLLTDEKPDKNDPDFQMVQVEQAYFGNSADKDTWKQMPLVIIHGLRWDQRKKEWKPLVLMTNLPLSEEGASAGPFTFAQIAQLYRRRWEIETFFKFIKQHLSYNHIVSRTENGVEIMILMSLIAALLLIWYKRLTRIDRGWRSVKFWLANDTAEWLQEILLEAMDIRKTRHRTTRHKTTSLAV